MHGGFTLVEALVAVIIFSIATVTLMGSLGKGISDTGYAKAKMTAEYLAVEGIEYMRALRDTHVLFDPAGGAVGWTSFNSNLTDASACNGANGCYFDDRNISFSDNSMPIFDLLLTACSSSSCPNGALLYDSVTGKFGYVSGTPSDFTRKIQTVAVNADETKISSIITYTFKGAAYTITFSENLYNWVE